MDVISLRRSGDASDGEVGRVRVHRIDVQRHQGAGIGTYLAEYLDFFVRAAIRLMRAHRRRHYALVQVATLPDWLVLAAAPLRLVGVPVLIDLHESMPDFFRSRFPGASNPVVHRGLLLAERASIAAASHAITVNEALRARLLGLGVAATHVSVVRNTPSLARFDPSAHPTRSFMTDGTLRLVYAGALTPTYELDVAIRALAALAHQRPDLHVHFDLYGRGDSAPGLDELAVQLGIGDRVTLHGRIPLDEVPAAIARADIGLAPTRRDAFTDSSLSTKILEYAAMRRAAVASRLPLVVETFPDGVIATYEAGNPEDLAAAILALVNDPGARESAIEGAARAVAGISWERDAEAYLALLGSFARDG